MTTTKKSGRSLVFKILLIVAAVILLPIIALSSFLFIRWNTGQVNTFDKTNFTAKLPIPALAPSTVDKDGKRQFDLTLQQGQTAFFGEGAKTDTWGVNGSYLGPTLRVQRGEEVQMKIRNTLPETTSVHWHGMHLPASMDGGPHQPIAPDATWTPHWKINQPAATLWYHPHPHGETRKHVYRGVAGMIIVDDDISAKLQLPKTYGVDDIPVIVQDKAFKDNNQLDFGTDSASAGLIGREVLVNGARTPFVDVSTGLVRLRLLNGSNARTYNFGLSNNEDMTLIATDGGFIEKPTPLTRLELSPGERAEVLVQISPKEKIHLRSYPIDLKVGGLDQRANGGDDSLEIMQIRTKPTVTLSPTVPTQLATVEKLDAAQSTKTREFMLRGNAINNLKMDMNRLDFGAVENTTETWRVSNGGDAPHNFHVHGVHFQVVSFNGQPVPPHMQGLKDTLFLRGSDTAELLMRFNTPTDAKYPFMFHCHLLKHEDAGMMGQFVVVGKDDVIPTTLNTDHHGH